MAQQKHPGCRGKMQVLQALPASVLRPGLSDPAVLGTRSPGPTGASTGIRNHRNFHLRPRCEDSPTRPFLLSGSLDRSPVGIADPGDKQTQVQ